MLGRFDLRPVLRGHLKGLTRADRDRRSADVAARLVIFGVPIATAFAMYFGGAGLSAPEALLTGVALLAGGTLTVFGSLSVLRLRLTADAGDDNRMERDGLDESVAHLLAAALACVFDAVVLVVGMNLRPAPVDGHAAQTEVTGIPAALAGGLSVYVVVVFLVMIPRLYFAYTSINDVSQRLSGYHQGRPFDD